MKQTSEQGSRTSDGGRLARVILLLLVFLTHPLLAQAAGQTSICGKGLASEACCCAEQSTPLLTPSCCQIKAPSNQEEQGEGSRLSAPGCDCLVEAPTPAPLPIPLPGLDEVLCALTSKLAGPPAEWSYSEAGFAGWGALEVKQARGRGGSEPLGFGQTASVRELSRTARLLLSSGVRGLLSDLSLWRS